jgi:predicted Zn-dependent protease
LVTQKYDISESIFNSLLGITDIQRIEPYIQKRDYKMKTKKFFISICLFLMLFLSCRGLDVNIFPDSYDVQLGAQFNSEIISKPAEYPIMTGRSDLKGYITEIGNKILASPDIKKRNAYPWKFEVIKDDNTINAFCVPGGYVYVYTGLMKFIDDEATLAGIIAHEIAHAEKRHSTRRVTGQIALQVGAAIAVELIVGENSETWKKVVVPLLANLLVTGIALYNSRDDEYEADEFSFKYLSSTEYYPGAIKEFFIKINEKKQQGGFDKFVTRLFSTHPLPPDRLEKMDQLIIKGRYAPPSENNMFSRRYQGIKRTL